MDKVTMKFIKNTDPKYVLIAPDDIIINYDGFISKQAASLAHEYGEVHVYKIYDGMNEVAGWQLAKYFELEDYFRHLLESTDDSIYEITKKLILVIETKDLQQVL